MKVHRPMNLNKKSYNKIMKPVIKWSGGKGAEIPLFEHHIPEFDTYIEPFVGGGALFFHLEPKKSVISDLHKELIYFYTALKKGKGKNIKIFMENNPNDEETYYKVRDSLVADNDFIKACQFYYQRKTSYRGMLRYNKKGKFNIPFGRYKTINYSDIDSKNYEDIFKNCEIFNKDFDYIFDNYNSYDNFCFLDPPYDSQFTDYGYCSFGKEEHIRLSDRFKTTKMKCLMVIGKTDFIVGLYKDFIVDEYDKKYRFKIHSGRVGEGINTTHLVIKNYT